MSSSSLLAEITTSALTKKQLQQQLQLSENAQKASKLCYAVPINLSTSVLSWTVMMCVIEPTLFKSWLPWQLPRFRLAITGSWNHLFWSGWLRGKEILWATKRKFYKSSFKKSAWPHIRWGIIAMTLQCKNDKSPGIQKWWHILNSIVCSFLARRN